MTTPENWWWFLTCREPFWDMELLGSLTFCLVSFDRLSLSSCAQSLVGHFSDSCYLISRRFCILHNYMFRNYLSSTFDADIFIEGSKKKCKSVVFDQTGLTPPPLCLSMVSLLQIFSIFFWLPMDSLHEDLLIESVS